jgi:hypothetical protein
MNALDFVSGIQVAKSNLSRMIAKDDLVARDGKRTAD